MRTFLNIAVMLICFTGYLLAQDNLTEEEKNYLIAFLENGLQDPDLKRYVPTSVLSGNCFPNADEASKLDFGCD